MRLFKSSILLLSLFFAVQSTAIASDISDRNQVLDLFKKYINNMVQRVEKEEDSIEKRVIINNSLGDMISVFDKVSKMGIVSQNDKAALISLRANIQEKKNELNGSEGYKRIPSSELNNFANYIQQDLEQADTVTITISVTLLIVILVLLLLL